MKYFFILFLFLSATCTSKGQPPKLRINHVALSVLNLEKSRLFYQDVLRLELIPEPFKDGRHVWFSMGDNSQLHIIQNPPPIVVPPKNTHLAFSVADMNAFLSLLQKHRIPFEDWSGNASVVAKRPDGIQQIYLQDPDGYWIEVNDDYQ